MRKNPIFIKKGILFVAGFLVVVFLLQIVIFSLIKSIKVGEFGVLNQINQGKINCEILVCGSSRALKAINPEIIEDNTGMTSFNIASDGSDLGIQLPKLQWYLNHNKKPKYIIQELNQFGGDISSIIYEPYKYLAYLNNNNLFTGLKRLDKQIWIHKYIYPSNLLYFNFDFYLKLFKELALSMKGSDFLINGYYPDHSKWSGNLELLKSEYPEGIHSLVSDEFRNYISELTELCKKEQIILILTVVPNHHMMSAQSIEKIDATAVYSEYIDDKYVLMFNYANHEISMKEENFYNFTHLNARGAKQLSKLIAEDLLELINQSVEPL